MKILIAHNEYQYRGGEDSVVEAEIALLREYGHEVHLYRRSNHELSTLSRASAAVSSIWSYQSSNDIQQVCDHFTPEVIHVHNTFPLISPSLYWAAAKKKVPVVQTLHNFRLLCPQAMFFRNGKVCEDCIGKLPWRAVTHKCYRGSALQSAVTVTMLAQHRAIGTYQKQVALYIALNEFCRQKFIDGGLPAERIRIKPHFVRPGKSRPECTRNGGLFIGRLSEEKGLQVLIDAMKELGNVQLTIAGAGPLESLVKGAFGTHYIGPRNGDDLRELLSHACYLVVPSIGTETFGMVAIEAFESGTPVIASRQGGLNDLVKDGVTGLLFTPADPHDLAQKIAWAESHPDKMLKMGQAAKEEYEKKYTPEQNYRQLMSIYYLAQGALGQRNLLSNAA
jgi:glycosyltransferase involved in cell wall biosynthesis